jgi:hypothetical protein
MIPVPAHLAEAPQLGGLVVPFTTLRHLNGTAAFGFVDATRVEACLRNQWCGICGAPVSGKLVFLMRPGDLARACSVEPGMCPPCAAYAQRACPMVAGKMDAYRTSVPQFADRRCGDGRCHCRYWVRDKSPARLGAPSEAWHALWTYNYNLIGDPEGRLAAGFSGVRVLAIKPARTSAAKASP